MDHAAEAQRLAEAASGNRRDTTSDADMIADAILAATHALFDVAVAVREQTAEMKAQGRASQRAEPAW